MPIDRGGAHGPLLELTLALALAAVVGREVWPALASVGVSALALAVIAWPERRG